MAVTENSILAGMQPPQLFAKAVTGTMGAGVARSLWNLAGFPGAGAYNATLNGVTLTAPQNGQIPFADPSGGNAAYLARLAAAGATQPGMLILADRIWHNGNYTR